jgi:hypothetical protein
VGDRPLAVRLLPRCGRFDGKHEVCHHEVDPLLREVALRKLPPPGGENRLELRVRVCVGVGVAVRVEGESSTQAHLVGVGHGEDANRDAFQPRPIKAQLEKPSVEGTNGDGAGRERYDLGPGITGEHDAVAPGEHLRRDDPVRRVVVARDRHHGAKGSTPARTVAPHLSEVPEGAVEQLLGVTPGIEGIEEIPGDEHQIRVLPAGELDDLGEHLPLLIQPGKPFETLTDVPVGGVEDLHRP